MLTPQNKLVWVEWELHKTQSVVAYTAIKCWQNKNAYVKVVPWAKKGEISKATALVCCKTKVAYPGLKWMFFLELILE